MNNIWTAMRRRDGAALFTVMLLILVIASLLGVAYSSSVQRVFTARKLADRVRALAIAEAGANKAYSILQTNFAARLNDTDFPSTSYAGGTFDVTVTPVSNIVAVVASLGVFGNASELVIMDAKNYGSINSLNWDTNTLDYAILSGGDFDFGGSGSYSSPSGAALVHANGPMTIRGNAGMNLDIKSATSISIGNNKIINGSIQSPSMSYDPSMVTITGTSTVAPVPLVPIPDIDLTPYYNHALANGQVYNSSQTLSGDFTPPGGIMWVNGTLSLAGNATYNGSFIATGDMSVSGDGAVNNTNSYPTLVSRDGDMSFTGQKSVQGLIYVKTGDYQQTGGNTHEGQLIVKGNIDKGGNSDVIVYSRSTIIPPGSTDNGDDIIGISAWQK